MKRDLEFAVTYPRDIELVWRAITDPEAKGLMTSFMLGRGWKSKILGGSPAQYLTGLAVSSHE